MKTLFTIILLLAAVVAASAQTKNQTREQREDGFRQDISKAKWVPFVTDSYGVPFSIDSLTMTRFMSIVTFHVKTEKRGTITYDKIVGGCTKDTITVVNSMMSNPGASQLVGGELDDAETLEAEKGTIAYAMLDYVCKNAKVMKVD